MTLSKAAPPNQEQANFRHLVMDIAWFGLAFPATDRFLSVYAIHLGADAGQLALLASLPALMLLFSASLGNWWVRRFTDPVKSIFWPGFGFRLIFLLPAFTPFLPLDFQPTWLILSLVLPAIPQGIASVAFLVMFREAVTEKRVAPLLGRRILVLNIIVAISGLVLGVWLEHVAFPLNYQVMYVAAFILTLISMWHLTQIRVLPHLATPPKIEKSRVNPWRSSAFQTVAFIVVITHITFFSIRPLIPLHLVDNLGANEGFISFYALAELAAGAIMTLFVRRIVERIGNRTMIAIAMIGSGLGSLLISAAQTLPLTLLASAIIGASWAAVAIGVFAFFSETTPMEDKAPYTTAYNQVVFLAMFIGPMLGKVLSGQGLSLVSIILVGALLRILAGMLTNVHLRVWFARAIKPYSSPQ